MTLPKVMKPSDSQDLKSNSLTRFFLSYHGHISKNYRRGAKWELDLPCLIE